MMQRRLLPALTVTLCLLPGLALAQTPAPERLRLRGTVDAVAADTLAMTTRAGTKAQITLPGNLRVTQVFAVKPEDIKPGSYIGTPAEPEPDGTLRALAVTVFPPSARGVAEGHFAWDLTPSSSMTNGTVGEITAAQGRMMTVTYAGGEQRVRIPDDTPIVSFEPAERALLVSGAQVIVNATRAADGVLTAVSISVGRDGMVPPT